MRKGERELGERKKHARVTGEKEIDILGESTKSLPFGSVHVQKGGAREGTRGCGFPECSYFACRDCRREARGGGSVVQRSGERGRKGKRAVKETEAAKRDPWAPKKRSRQQALSESRR